MCYVVEPLLYRNEAWTNSSSKVDEQPTEGLFRDGKLLVSLSSYG